MDIEAIIAELNKLIEQLQGAEDGADTSEDEERVSQLVAELEQRVQSGEGTKKARTAAVDAARRAIETGQASPVDNVPLARTASGAQFGGGAYDTTDYEAAQKRAYFKDIAARAGIQLAGGNELTDVERRAFTILTSNTDAAVPVELQNEIIKLIDGSAVLFSDVRRSMLKHQFELLRHKAITAGDAAKTGEGDAPVDEQNEFDTITLTGDEIKKTVKMSRKMSVQSLDGFEAYIKQEVSDRLSVAGDTFVVSRMSDSKLGIATANRISCKTAGTLAKADLTGSFGKLKTFGNAVPKGAIVYANNDTIWNQIAMIEDATKRSYFVDEKTEDPTVQGRIFGKTVKLEDNLADGVMLIGYPDLFRGNIFDGPDVRPYIENGTQKHCFDGYLLFDGGLAVPQGFVMLTIGNKA
ncbi:MAG: phage major capsid protein [Gordonibacter sp.]|uniref:phage major capsid protein n=1 Tax=Gordonibacter sp. TaxID=1968902 RepID=UPI002FCA2D5C